MCPPLPQNRRHASQARVHAECAATVDLLYPQSSITTITSFPTALLAAKGHCPFTESPSVHLQLPTLVFAIFGCILTLALTTCLVCAYPRCIALSSFTTSPRQTPHLLCSRFPVPSLKQFAHPKTHCHATRILATAITLIHNLQCLANTAFISSSRLAAHSSFPLSRLASSVSQGSMCAISTGQHVSASQLCCALSLPPLSRRLASPKSKLTATL